MKSIILLISLMFSATTYAQVVNRVEYKVTNYTCTQVMPTGSCFYYDEIAFNRDQATGEITMERMTNSSTDVIYMYNQNVDTQQQAIVVDDQFKRLNFFRSSEIFSQNTDFVIDTLSIGIQFYQIDPVKAVIIETITSVTSDGAAQYSVVVDLEKK